MHRTLIYRNKTPRYIRVMEQTVIIKKGGPHSSYVKDIFSPKTSEELIDEWEKGEYMQNLTVRDSLLESMRLKSVRPDTWIQDRDSSTGVYPDIDDPDFAAKLYRKTEFASLRSTAVGEDTCAKVKETFETTAVQRLVARFLHPSTPYNGILLHHGVGVGKTCSAITVAETFLETLPMNTVYIIVPQAIADGFKRTIFDANRLVLNTKEEYRLTGERWRSPQCSGMTYLHLTGMADNPDINEIADAVDSEIKRRYKIMGYLAFANFIEAEKKKVPAAVVGQERIDAENARLMSLFSDHLLIVDEAHNLRDSDGDDDDEIDKTKQSDLKEGKKLTPLLKQIVRVSEGLRLMLMTATPMYNTAPEILFLLNLLSLNDTKDDSLSLKTKDIFKESDHSFVPGGEEKLQRLIKRYVSFMRGEHPNTFPLRLTPPSSIQSDFVYPTVSMKLSEETVKLSDMDKNIMFQLPLIVHSITAETKMGQVLQDILKAHVLKGDTETGGREVTNLDSFIQIGNLVYPDGTYGKAGLSSYFDEKKQTILGQKMVQYVWKKKNPSIESVFGMDGGLQQHSPKIASIVESITNAKGMSFVFSRYKKSGAIPIAIALELAGWCRILADGTLAPLLKREFKKPPTMFYILLTSDDSLSPDFKGLLKYATTLKTDAEYNGSKVKAIIGSQIASEGLDLKCIREIHLLEGWFHLNRIEQIEGRGVRFCSHVGLPIEERNCLIYLHALNVPTYETADLYMYRLAIRKAQPIGRVTRLMKINAWDCMLNRDAILLTDLPKRDIVDAQGRSIKAYDLHDKPFTSFCDFSDTCEFLCAGKQVPGENTSTYKESDFHYKLLKKQEMLVNMFSDEVAWPLKTIKDIVYGDIPWSVGEIALRELLGKLRIKREGIVGTLIYQNGYIVFQPDIVTDTKIPLASRYSRAYGFIPRSIKPDRGSIFTSDAEPIDGKVEDMKRVKKLKMADKRVAKPVEKATKPDAQDENTAADVNPNKTDTNIYSEAINALAKWRNTLKDIFSKPYGHIEQYPSDMAEATFRGWRWVFHYFRSIPETKSVALLWWIDNFWTLEQRRAVLQELTVRKNEELSEEERELSALFRPIELFQGDKIRGYFTYNLEKERLQTFCNTSLNPLPIQCPSLLMNDVENIVGKPLDRILDTGKVFGFLSYEQGVMLAKTVLKAEGKKLNLDGAQCIGVSNLGNHFSRIQEIHKHLSTDAALQNQIVQDSPDTKPDPKTSKARKDYVVNLYTSKATSYDPDLDVKHMYDMSLKQLCPYIEFLLRLMDMKRIEGKRWMLSVVDMSRILKK